MEPLPVQRPGSLRSMHSNSSIGSAVNLTRRPRTTSRARSKTFNGGGTRPDDVPQLPSAPSDLPYLSGPIVQEPSDDQTTSSQEPLNTPPIRPPRSPQRLEAEIRSSDTASSQQATDADPTFVEPVVLPQASIPPKPSKANRHASSLPHLDTGYRPPPSAFQRDPALTPVNNLRDSVSTQQSGVSSSLYPPSTSTASGPESPPSPQSIVNQIEVAPFDVEVNEVQEYDSDDVAYRLRLLVKNNYFLPPAHSKPSPADFAPSPVDPSRKSPRPTGPAFLDLFRVGKSKSKPTTPPGPVSPYDPTKPMLRTTSDSITPTYGLTPNQPRSSTQGPHPALHSPLPAMRGRVVVVREKMNDIATAAKQAEQDLKLRGVRLDTSSQQGNSASVDDIIDPTDAVDLPLPSPSYPFAVQASAIHGLGVLESVGANVLADRLIPGKSPNMSSTYDAAEDTWRKALLHQAVHHSLDNTTDVSTFSHIIDASTPVGSPRTNPVDVHPDVPTSTQTLIQQKIAVRPSTDATTPKAKHARQNSTGSVPKSATRGRLNVVADNRAQALSRPSSYLPQRVDTPSGPMTPLGPPPRRFITAQHSLSQSDLSTGHLADSLDIDDEHRPRILRRTASSPLLADGYHSSASRDDFSSPPPIPSYLRDSQATVTSFSVGQDDYQNIGDILSETHESDVEGMPRMSLALSAMQSRPSLSEYSQASLSPTTSNFQDMLNHDTQSSSSVAGPSRFSVEHHPYRSTITSRSTAMSPPPRISSSLAHVALSPPPRASSKQYQSTAMHVQSLASSGGENEVDNSRSGDPTFQINAPDPTTPPFPLSPAREHFSPLSVESHPSSSSTEIHPAPGPSAVTSFFDSIQSQPNAMDDLDSSSDESDDDEPQPMQPKLFVDPRHRAISSASASATFPRPQIMKHGNLSAPYIRQNQNMLPVGHDARSKQPIANSPPLISKNDTQTSPYDFYRYAQGNPLNFSALAGAADNIRRPSTADPVTAWRNTQKAQESLRKLDGMLIQHMEDEKDTIKRIATQLKQTGDSTAPV